MSGPARVKSMSQTEFESRPVLGPAGNKARTIELKKPAAKPKKAAESDELVKGKRSPTLAVVKTEDLQPAVAGVGVLKKKSSSGSVLMRSNLSMNASCSSDASTDSSSHSRASTGRISRGRVTTPTSIKRKQQQCSPRIGKVEKSIAGCGAGAGAGEGFDSVVSGGELGDSFEDKKRCAWVTSKTDPCYAAFHDEEWGVPVHDDKKLFEFLSLSTALAELSWPTILNKRQIFREVFQDFDPIAVSRLNEKKIATPGSLASSLLSELKLRAIIENARQTCKIIDEHGSFDKYIWGFVNHKPIIGQFRYARQVPNKTSKADAISKDLVRRGFRGIGPTPVYSFMQVAGITNDHLISCFRYHECITGSDARGKDESLKAKIEGKHDDGTDLGLVRVIDDLSLST